MHCVPPPPQFAGDFDSNYVSSCSSCISEQIYVEIESLDIELGSQKCVTSAQRQNIAPVYAVDSTRSAQSFGACVGGMLCAQSCVNCKHTDIGYENTSTADTGTQRHLLPITTPLLTAPFASNILTSASTTPWKQNTMSLAAHTVISPTWGQNMALRGQLDNTASVPAWGQNMTSLVDYASNSNASVWKLKANSQGVGRGPYSASSPPATCRSASPLPPPPVCDTLTDNIFDDMLPPPPPNALLSERLTDDKDFSLPFSIRLKSVKSTSCDAPLVPFVPQATTALYMPALYPATGMLLMMCG